ncbi:MAG: MATE family efflux transporter [Eubacteriales bacterium]|nr:MATE family efflux transporter [Eubacteriales bacterium]
MKEFLDRKFGSTLFSRKQIFSMLVPLIMDSFFVCAIGVLTTAMISSSSQESVSAVSLVSPLYMMIYAVYNAISAGGTVVVAQFKGKGETERMKTAAGQLMLATPLSAVIACAVLVAFADPLVHFLFGGVEETVLAKAEQYLIGIAISMVFLAVYMSGFAVFRGLGETKRCLRLTILINLLHFIASFVFINMMRLDIMGSVLALNLARLVGGAAAVWMLLSPRSILRVQARHIFHLDRKILHEIFRIGIPFGMEQLFMNGGSMLVQIYIAQLGTVSVAANAVANSVFSLLYAAPSAVGTLAVTVVGQCIGAGDKTLARRYGGAMVWLTTALTVLSLAVGLPLMPLLLRMYQAPDNTVRIIYGVLAIAAVCMPFFWPASNVLPSVMRSAGDASYASYFSLVTMWVIRVGLGYVLAIPLGLGIEGVWIGMCLEWAVKTVAFVRRFRGERWLAHEQQL